MSLVSRFIHTFLILFMSQQVVASPNYIKAPPLTDYLSGIKVGKVSTQSATQIPIITWGGDIATILANGNSSKTKPGSIFADQGLELKLVREDIFSNQLRAYVSGRSPYLRGTLGMINMAVEATSKDARIKPVVIYQMTWSTGGDALVVKPGIHSIKDLKGKTIAVQAYGPHVDYMTKILADAGLSVRDINIRWVADLTGTENAPMAALQQKDIDAAFVIIPDAMVLTSGGAVGSGAEDSVKGARILLSTRTANRIIADVYAVRSDYLKSHHQQVKSFVHGLMQAEGKLKKIFAGKTTPAFRALSTEAARILFDSPKATADIEGLFADCEFVGWQGNVDFFKTSNYPRSLSRLTHEIQPAFIKLGLLNRTQPLSHANWNYDQLLQGLDTTRSAGNRRFDQKQVAAVIARKQQQGTLGSGELFKFEIFFQPNQNSFSADLYQSSFGKVMDYSATYGGALITIEGHSDPLGYLKKRKKGESELVLGRIKQSAKNLSLSRAISVRDSIIGFADKQSITLDSSQFAVVGHGISTPKSGNCGSVPCAPKTEKAWRDNMRVEFRIIQVEAEESVFNPL